MVYTQLTEISSAAYNEIEIDTKAHHESFGILCLFDQITSKVH